MKFGLAKEVKEKLCELSISSESGCNSGGFFRSTFTFTIVLFKYVIWISPTMLSIPKTMKMEEETKTKKIDSKLLASNAVEDSVTIEEISIICGFAILVQWMMKLVDHVHK